MITFVKIIYYILFYTTLLYGTYFAVSGFLGIIMKSKVKFKKSKKKNFFAIIVAARNESQVIGNLVESLKELDYPKDRYGIFIVPNNCTDNTSKVALDSGATVLECNVKTKTKGDVLKFAFNKLKDNKEIDAYVIFDADNLVHKDFLKHMNDCLNSGYKVAEGYRDSKNPKDNWISGSYTIFYLFQNIFFNRSRMSFDASASINGTGFMVKKELIDEMGFPTQTLTEDIEFTALCALRDERIAFVENAVTYDEQPVEFKASWKQRKRWSVGCLQCLKLYWKDLLGHFFKTGSQPSFDMFMNFVAPVVQVICLVEFVALIFFRIFNIRLYDIFSSLFSSGAVFMILTYVSGVVVSIFILKYNKRKAKNLLSAIALFAVFILTWIPINVVCLFTKDMKWEEIKHNRGIASNEMKFNK